MTPTAEERDYPTLLSGVPAPRVFAYRREVSLAEKFEAMVKLGRRNSRMKDFHDVWALSSTFAFEGPVLLGAVGACFGRRGTPWPELAPDVLSSTFCEVGSLKQSWASYLGSAAFLSSPPTDFVTVGERVREFLGPVHEALVAQASFEMRWPAGGPWRSG